MSYQIVGLDPKPFEAFFDLGSEQLSQIGALRLIAEGAGMPCRVSLQDAEAGEELLLINYEHQSAATPYRACHAIFVRRHATQSVVEIDVIPDMLKSRLLSVRAFDEHGMMIGAEVCEGTSAGDVFEEMLLDCNAAYLQAHTARHGCFLANIQRAD